MRSLSRQIGLRDITTAAIFLSLSLSSRWRHVEHSMQQHSANRITWRDNEPGRLSVFALLSNAHSRHNGCCQGVFQFFSEEGQDSPLGYIYVWSKRSENETETGGTERSELNGRDPRVRASSSRPSSFWEARHSGSATTGLSERLMSRRHTISARLLRETRRVHTPSSTTMSLINRRVYTQSTTNHIYSGPRCASSAGDGEHGGDLYLGIAETWPKFVAIAEEDGGCQLLRPGKTLDESRCDAILTIF